ncbi:hypothetical protein PR048_008415 [Dryococelus australis]|uniref:Transposase n=1 Tax=Dryococelus australis TaxID=614101 RepID=A0ABQ9HXU7_9NEOP|nr:hypothetical protein PR048_008415 [Dryococelus australis]
MARVFWDHQGVLLIDFMELGTTINAAAYCATLRRLQQSICNKQRRMLTSGVVLLHDNARPHSTASPDLTQSDFHLFLALKKWLGGQRVNTNEELQYTVTTLLNRQAATFFTESIGKLVHQYDKCFNGHGDYIEK